MLICALNEVLIFSSNGVSVMNVVSYSAMCKSIYNKA